jgi:uncharacterized protein YdeI (YjbR/CyaY-like superfamily)
MESVAHITANTLAELRHWLIKNHQQKESVWLIRRKKGKGPVYLSCGDLVDELLCFGWVDSLPKKLDENRSMILISPRKASSNWSAVNKQRVERLKQQERMQPAGLGAVELAKQNGKWDFLNDVEAGIIPEDLKQAFKKHPRSEAFFGNFPKSSKRGILEWIKNAKTSNTRAKRVEITAEKASNNIRPIILRVEIKDQNRNESGQLHRH